MLTTEGSKYQLETVKIKQEKLTPPPTPNTNSLSAAPGLNITDDLLNDILGERKPIAEPVKSSNEILADLFKVFNAAPPTLDDDNTTKDPKKKKHKKEKKLKKHKKRSRDNSESKTSDNELNKIKKKHKSKRSKKREANESDTDSKSHKRHKKSNDREIKIEKIDVIVKKEKNDDVQKHASTVDGDESHTHNDITSNKLRSTEEKNPQLNIQVSVTKDNDRRKIVIKNLVDSTIFQDTLKEVDAKQKEKDREKLKEKGKHKEKEREKTKEKEKERNKEKERRKQSSRRSKSYEKEYRRARSHSSSLSLSDEETYLRERERERNRDRDRDKERDDFYGDYRRDADRDKDIERRRHRSRNDFYHHDKDRRRSRSSSRHRRERTSDRIDKKRLLEIARKNAITMLKNGTLPGVHNLDPEAKERALTKMRYGGKSVDELTEFCKKLSKGEANGYLSNISGDSDIDADLEKPFHHPFVIKDRGPIVMNIKNSTIIPPKSAEQTKAILQQFPVSSGQHHRLNESEWVPVVPTKETEPTTNTTKSTTETTNILKSKGVNKPEPTNIDDVPQPTADYGYQNNMFSQPPEPSEPPSSFPMLTNIEPVPLPTENSSGDNIFAHQKYQRTSKELDVTSIVTSRLNALRKLQENPLDSEAIKLMYKTQKDMSAWASSKFVPGQFTGSTGASILSTKELASGFQAWAKRDQLISTTPVSGGMGMHLLQKMGWKPGEGLGKEKNGSLQPLLLEVKLDKKGLVAEEESPQVQRQRAQVNKKAKATSIQMAKQNFESKHPVSLLGELSSKRKFGAPLYELVMQEGPSHQRQFLYSVTINGQVYQPNITSLNKKEAKASAAKYALQQMGFLPDVPMQASAPQQPEPPVQNNVNFAPPNAF